MKPVVSCMKTSCNSWEVLIMEDEKIFVCVVCEKDIQKGQGHYNAPGGTHCMECWEDSRKRREEQLERIMEKYGGEVESLFED